MSKPKIAILGGGMAGLATAWRLTRQPDWRDRFESVTVHQLGWRLGGKCATGRGPFDRVEEHGIHLFGGGYYNTLAMMRDVCAEAFPGSPGEFDHRFEDQYTSVAVDGHRKRVRRFQPSALTLADAAALDTPGELFATALAGLLAQLRVDSPAADLRLLTRLANGGVLDFLGLPGPQNLTTAGWLDILQNVVDQVRNRSAALGTTLDRLKAVIGPDRAYASFEFLAPGGEFKRLLPERTQALQFRTARWMGMLNLAYALGNGYLQDFVRHPKTFSALDDEDYTVWLRRHGAWDSTLELDVALAPIRILYQYRGGDASSAANRSMGAGAYLHWTLRTLAYVKAPFWFFTHGTGDTVVAPLYTVLAQRGVRFEFFHKVESLSLSADGRRVAQIKLRKQASTRSGQPYEPLECGHWPAAPRAGELVEGDAIARLPPDELESYWSDWQAGNTCMLEESRDFDEVVLAISLGALPFVCADLIAADPAWAAMVQHVKTVETQSLQLWFDRTSEELGINDNADQDIETNDSGLGAGLAVPHDGFADFSSLIAREGWPATGRPKALWYFSDVLRTAADVAPIKDPSYPQRRRDAVFAKARQFLARDIGRLLSSFDKGFDHQRLVSTTPTPPATDDGRLAQQVVRANFQPSERYVQALAGTTKFRLDAGRSARFGNLSLAGDWTYNGLNVGCVEAAVMSGLLAANDLLGRPHADQVAGWFGR
jgi:uncharacterized protein with NAD-binding domain and iron-sulfur cluster